MSSPCFGRIHQPISLNTELLLCILQPLHSIWGSKSFQSNLASWRSTAVASQAFCQGFMPRPKTLIIDNNSSSIYSEEKARSDSRKGNKNRKLKRLIAPRPACLAKEAFSQTRSMKGLTVKPENFSSSPVETQKCSIQFVGKFSSNLAFDGSPASCLNYFLPKLGRGW